MSAGYQALTEKEKQTLRLIVRGYDAKSMARHLGLSIHTVNERLRDARRKLEVSSSRAAARLVFETEEEAPNLLADRILGDAEAQGGVPQDDGPKTGSGATHRFIWVIAGVVIMSLVLGLLALSSLSYGTASPAVIADAPGDADTPTAVAESDAVRAARAWLALHDQGRWDENWEATSESFRKLNTRERWAAVAREVRPPLGALISRTH